MKEDAFKQLSEALKETGAHVKKQEEILNRIKAIASDMRAYDEQHSMGSESWKT